MAYSSLLTSVHCYIWYLSSFQNNTDCLSSALFTLHLENGGSRFLHNAVPVFQAIQHHVLSDYNPESVSISVGPITENWFLLLCLLNGNTQLKIFQQQLLTSGHFLQLLIQHHKITAKQQQFNIPHFTFTSPGQLNKYHKIQTETHTNCLAISVKSWPVLHLYATISFSNNHFFFSVSLLYRGWKTLSPDHLQWSNNFIWHLATSMKC